MNLDIGFLSFTKEVGAEFDAACNVVVIANGRETGYSIRKAVSFYLSNIVKRYA